MKNFILLLLIFINLDLFAGESIDITVKNQSVKIINKDVFANCCSIFKLEHSIDDFLLTITETDTSTSKCHCMCLFNLEFNLDYPTTGKYHVKIYRREYEKYIYPKDTIYLVGESDFEIVNQTMPPSKYSYKQSDCLGLGIDKNESKADYHLSINDDALIIDNAENISSIEIFDLLGRVVYKENHSDNIKNLNIPLNNFNSNIYFVKIIEAGKQQLHKIIRF